MNLPHEIADAILKSFPGDIDSMSVADIGKQQWNLLNGAVPMPAAILLNSALENNVRWMRDFLNYTKISFAPHGKTTLSPQLFQRQTRDGAWGITVATFQQAYLCWRAGIKTILLANQLIDRASIQGILTLLRKDPELKFYCLVDSVAGCELLASAAKNTPINVLIEIGFNGGRAGCRSLEETLAVAKAITDSATLKLSGIECYEGTLVSKDHQNDIEEVKQLLTNMMDVAKLCDEKNYFSASDEIILTAGGSSYFDLVATYLTKIKLSKPTRVVMRSGCYLTHDAKFQNGLFEFMTQRFPEAFPIKNKFLPALEVWSTVLSRPEPELAILSFGKRDASYDIDLPIPQKWFQSGLHTLPVKVSDAWQITKLNDQHAYLKIPNNAKIAVGDLVGCGISHACTTFDKWQLLYLVDDAYTIIDAIKTYF